MNPTTSSIPFKHLNPSGAPLSTEKLRTFSGFEHCSEQDATSIIETLKTLARILIKNVGKYSSYKAPKTLPLEQSLLTRKAA